MSIKRITDGLLPCPFCGSRVAISEDRFGGFEAFCQNGRCPIVGVSVLADSMAEAAFAWNTRTAPVPLPKFDPSGEWRSV